MSDPENMMPDEPEDQGGDNPAPEPSDAGPLEALQAELDETKDRMMRALADSENTRKRSQKDREDIGKYAIANFARDLLDFSDNFGRALQAIPEELKNSDDERMKSVFSGLEAMEREILAVFEKHEIQKIEPLDEPFNPNFHEVMFETPVPGKKGGTIIQVVEPGYVLHDRLLRAAKVGIAKDGEPEPPPGDHQIDKEV